MSNGQSVVSYYGVHIAPDGVAYLEQGRGGTNAVGLRERSPFQVRLAGQARPCNHNIQLAAQNPVERHMQVFGQVFADPLVQAMLPVPRKGPKAFYVAHPGDGLDLMLAYLAKMSSPIYPIVADARTTSKETILDELSVTNVQPYVLTGWRAEQNALMAEIGASTLTKPRTLVCTGEDSVELPPQVKRVTTKLADYPLKTLMELPMETIGATMLRYFMRKSWTWGTPLPNPEKDSSERRAARAAGHFIRPPGPGDDR